MQYARTWNVPVSNFVSLRRASVRRQLTVGSQLLKHVYSATRSSYGFSRWQAAIATFTLSAAVHELLMAVVSKKLRLYLFSMQVRARRPPFTPPQALTVFAAHAAASHCARATQDRAAEPGASQPRVLAGSPEVSRRSPSTRRSCLTAHRAQWLPHAGYRIPSLLISTTVNATSLWSRSSSCDRTRSRPCCPSGTAGTLSCPARAQGTGPGHAGCRVTWRLLRAHGRPGRSRSLRDGSVARDTHADRSHSLCS